jgi:hypothetical protein
MTAKWMTALLMSAMSLAGWGQPQSEPQGPFAITSHQVAQALSANGIQIEDQQISLLAKVVSTEPAPLLDVLSVQPDEHQPSAKDREARSLVKLACRLPASCLPFYSLVSWPEGTAPRTLGAALDAPGAVLKAHLGITMRAGAHATLVMNDGRSHIQVAVVSLESGATGQTIRVASPDHKQTYLAEVVSPNLLKGNF